LKASPFRAGMQGLKISLKTGKQNYFKA